LKVSRFPAPPASQSKAAARATAFQKRFFACGETALSSLPALDGMIGLPLWLRQPGQQSDGI
jgi:hypothetical protein